ncbi:protein of unknown function (plasmid) [Vibrio tapetis subsp. tapetis]|uniref:Uncharacterized protein n=1 Tax=Vibrio tapetis subsp. tapetis TaxID=1671868 RepID=A0A2N8ZHS0_9VIBR|nr:protein of unknown function [Vibrio tapetis subsp. tapetis]SON53496.1 protein of unknown function [Vibrio tapetis subsp. tapetis]
MNGYAVRKLRKIAGLSALEYLI